MTTEGKPLVIVGSEQEVGFSESAGVEAWSTAGLDAAGIEAMVYRVRDERRLAIVLLDPEDGEEDFMEACVEAGAVARAVSQKQVDRFIPDETTLDEWRDGFIALINDEVASAEGYYSDALRGMQESRRNRLHVHDAMNIAMDLYLQTEPAERIPTGIGNLDKAIGGGLPQGLTVLAAGSSNGKTTLLTQISDNIAASGRPVLFVTVEQSRQELVAKSLSRMMRLTPKRNGGYHVASSAHIRSAQERAKWSADKEEALLKAASDYASTIAPRMFFLEKEDGQPSVADIRRAFDAIAEDTGRTPVLCVDYLQLLKAKDERMTDRRAIDTNVTELRILARQRKTAVVVISSINRASYFEGADMSSFKESGMVEYSADLALVLQPRGYGERVSEKKTDKAAKDEARKAMAEHKSATIRKSEICVLKNREGGMPPKPVPLMFNALCNLFTEDGEASTDVEKKRVL